MPIRTDDPRPPYQQLAAELRQAISDGEYEPGDRLPSRRKLAVDYRIAETTVVHAIEVLENEGLVVAQHGRGVYVQEPKAGPNGPEAPKSIEESLAETVKELEEANELLARYQAAGIDPPELPGPEAAPTVEPGVDL